jgi:hypothetical protein
MCPACAFGGVGVDVGVAVADAAVHNTLHLDLVFQAEQVGDPTVPSAVI